VVSLRWWECLVAVEIVAVTATAEVVIIVVVVVAVVVVVVVVVAVVVAIYITIVKAHTELENQMYTWSIPHGLLLSLCFIHGMGGGWWGVSMV